MSTSPPRSLGLGLVLLVALTLTACVSSLAWGSNNLPLSDVWRALWHEDSSQASVIVHDLRLPRTWLAVLVGAALGAAGAIMQGHTRNPLADPGILGISAGASFAVVVAIYALGIDRPTGYVWFALGGAAVACGVVFAIGLAGGRGVSPLTLVLAGMSVSALLGGLVTGLILTNQDTLDNFRFWAVGSVSGRDGTVTAQLAPLLVLGLLLALAHSPALNVLALGDDVARTLGQRPARTRAIGLVCVVLLTGTATAACGPIVFVGLVVPHLARLWTGPDHRWLVSYAAVLGALLLVTADVAGRVVARPAELQVGIVLAAIGGPFFVALVRRRDLVAL